MAGGSLEFLIGGVAGRNQGGCQKGCTYIAVISCYHLPMLICFVSTVT